MIPLRIFFEKTLRAKYTSHLDTMRTMTRALSRSGLPLWFTQGFNPHLYLAFSLPIALGYESLCESFDIRLVGETPHEEVLDCLNAVLPPGFHATRVAAPVMDASSIAWADYDITLRYAGQDIGLLHEKLNVLLKQPVIEVDKRSKKGMRRVDIRPHVRLLEVTEEPGALLLRLRTAAGSALNINPTLFLGAYYDWCNALPDGVRVVRVKLYNENLVEFM